MKPFLFIYTTIQVQDGSMVKSWELINLGGSNLMHAAWNPEKQLLVCQFDSVKENLAQVPVVGKNGKASIQDRRVEQYYRITVEDKNAIKYILENLTSNYVDQEWEIVHNTSPVEAMKPEGQESVID